MNAADAKRANTALHTAVSKNHVTVCAYLLKKNGNVKARNKAGKTPVELATTDEMRQLFAEAGRAKGRRSRSKAGGLGGALCSGGHGGGQ